MSGANAALVPGSTFGAYRIVEVLGRGGMGVVYKAQDQRSGRAVALKIVSSELARDATFQKRFQREGRAAAALRHENVVALHEAGEENGTPYLAFEHVEGGTLKAKLARGRLAWSEAAELGAGIARGLAAVHEAGLIHRDLKPDNVLLWKGDGSREIPKLADFGLVGAQASFLAVSAALTKTGEILGTLEYMAPEQADGQRALTARADLYSLGAVLYALVAGVPPFEGTGYALLKKHLVATPRSPRSLAPDLPRGFEWLILALLEKEPDNRPSSAAEVVRELEAISRGEAPSARVGSGRGKCGLAVASLIIIGAAGAIAFVLSRGTSQEDKEMPRPASPPKPLVNAKPPPASTSTASARDEARRLVASAVARAGAGDAKGAIADDTRAIELDPKLVAAWIHRVVLRRDQGDQDGAIADATRAIEIDPRCADAWSYRALARQSKRDLPGAIADFTRAAELRPDVWVFMNRSSARIHAGDFDAALADATRAIELGSDVAGAWVNRGIAHKQKDEVPAAIADLTRAIELDPRMAAAWGERGLVNETKGDLAGALADMTRALELDPKLVPLWVRRSDVHRMMGEMERSIAASTRALELDPRNVEALDIRGTARHLGGDLAGALADFTREIELDPGRSEGYKNRAGVRALTRDLDGAIADSTRAIELGSKSGIAWQSRAAARRLKGDYTGALADIEKAIEIEPREASALCCRGTVRESLKDEEGALADYTYALELDPKLADGWECRGWLRGRKGDLGSAISDLTRALELEPGRAAAWKWRGLVRRTSGDRAGATSDLERFLELGPGDPEAPAVRKLIVELRGK
ncbi:tetratricopeptide repeat protein [bacterium]|nr:tetratricopeptide repeat protein [bacterium]